MTNNNLNIVKLIFKDKARFGLNNKLENCKSEISSDVLFSAIFEECMLLYPDKTDVLLNNISISNGFPFYNSIYFFPKPNIDLNFQNETTRKLFFENFKKYRKIKHLSKNFFEKIINYSNITENDLNEEYLNINSIQSTLKEKIQYNLEIKNSVFEFNQSQENKNEFTKLYELKSLFFKENSGMYFFYQISDELDFLFKKIINSLGITGIGGKKNIGFGQFKTEFNKIQLSIPNEFTGFISLSDYIPEENELIHLRKKLISYQLTKKSGWLSNKVNSIKSEAIKPIQYAFAAGFCYNDSELKGKIHSFNEPYFYHRYAKTFNIKIKYPKKGEPHE